MAVDKSITELTALTGANVAAADQLVVVDVSDTTMAATGTDKNITAAELRVAMQSGPQITHLSGYYYSAQAIGGYGTATLVQAEEWAIPFWCPASATYDRIACYVTTVGSAGAVIRLGIYTDIGGKPGTLLLDAGTVVGTSTGGKEITISQALSAGTWYWISATGQGAPVTQTTVAGAYADAPLVGFAALGELSGAAAAFGRTAITGALSTWASWGSRSFSPRVCLRAP